MAREISAHSPATVKVLCWVLSMASACVVIIRFSTKFAMTKKWSIDDTMIVFALAFSIAQSVSLTVAASYNYGNEVPSTDGSQILEQEKLIYTSSLMFVLSMCFGMLATSQLIASLSPNRSHRIVALATTSATILWTIIAVFGFAFQCKLPSPWDFNGQCIHQRAFYTFLTCANLLIESSLILQPGLVVWNLQLALKRRVIIIACFCSRSFVVLALIGLMISVWQSPSDGQSASSYAVIICTILADNFSIMAANMPYLRPFMQGLEHGMTLGVGIAPRQTQAGSSNAPGSNPSYDLSKSRKSILTSAPRLQTIDNSGQWKFEQIAEEPRTFSMTDMNHEEGILHTSEFSVESHPIKR